MSEDSRKHLEFIQSVIARMGNNSFALKGWSVIVVAGLFAFAANNTSRMIPWIAVLPVTLFWVLDAYFLGQERLYRRLYDHLRTFSDRNWEELGDKRYSLAPKDYSLNVEPLRKVMLRSTLISLYGVLLASVVTFGVLVSRFR